MWSFGSDATVLDDYALMTSEMWHVSGQYADIQTILGDDDGLYSDIATGRDSVLCQSSVYEHYDFIDDGYQSTTGLGAGDHADKSRGYERLDPSVLATLRQPEEPHDYVGLATGKAAATTQQTAEIEMTAEANENTVHPQL